MQLFVTQKYMCIYIVSARERKIDTIAFNSVLNFRSVIPVKSMDSPQVLKIKFKKMLE